LLSALSSLLLWFQSDLFGTPASCAVVTALPHSERHRRYLTAPATQSPVLASFLASTTFPDPVAAWQRREGLCF